MTREEAIELLCAYGVPQDEKRFQEALDMAIEALQTDEELCKDCENCLPYDDETESGFLWCTVNTRPTTKEDFCSFFAERKEP